MALPKRKSIRLKDYDYSQNGIYFVTICSHNRECIFGNIATPTQPNVGTAIGRPHVALSKCGKVIERSITNINAHYTYVECEKDVIMPNHIHMMIAIHNPQTGGRPMVVPTLSVVINQMKGYVTKQIGHTVWQPRFHEHIIRNEKSFLKIWEYIDTNPLKWELDCYHTI